jgi:hypothetical protein
MPLQRADRAYGEILQEVRVAQTGVQILFAFLLTLAFTARFKSITPVQRDIYVVALMLAAAATALLIAPAAFHRVTYRRRLKQHLVHAANKLALAGLVLLLLAMISALVLILDVTTGMGLAMILGSGMLTWFFTWWFILPVCIRLRHSAGAGVRGQSPHAHAQPHGAPRHATIGESGQGQHGYDGEHPRHRVGGVVVDRAGVRGAQ